MGKVGYILLSILGLIALFFGFYIYSIVQGKFAFVDASIQESNSIKEFHQSRLYGISKALEGVWLPKPYIQKLNETGSAYEASKVIPQVAELQINPKQIKNDTLFVTSSLNNHEGYGFDIWLEEKNGKTMIASNVCNWDSDQYDFEWDYQIEPNPLIILSKKDRKGNIIDRTNFERVRDGKYISNFGGIGYEYLARKSLLNGKYQLLDSIKNNKGVITFEPEEGRISHFDYQYYTILTDYIGPIYEGNYVMFFHEMNNYHDYRELVMISKNDTTILFTTEENPKDYGEIILKTPVYFLLKK